jgi:hypothetical protein
MMRQQNRPVKKTVSAAGIYLALGLNCGKCAGISFAEFRQFPPMPVYSKQLERPLIQP